MFSLAVRHKLSYPDLMLGCPQTEQIVPRIDELMKDPGFVDRLLELIPKDKAALIAPDQITALRSAIKEGKSFIEILKMVPNEVLGEVWRRNSMMRFAQTLARSGNIIPATAIATASQWHNCHGFRCLLRHPNDVGLWLQQPERIAAKRDIEAQTVG